MHNVCLKKITFIISHSLNKTHKLVIILKDCAICFSLQSNSSRSFYTDLRSDLVKSAHLKRFPHHFKHSGKGQTRHHTDHTIYCKPHGQPAARDHATSTGANLHDTERQTRTRKPEWYRKETTDRPQRCTILIKTHTAGCPSSQHH